MMRNSNSGFYITSCVNSHIVVIEHKCAKLNNVEYLAQFQTQPKNSINVRVYYYERDPENSDKVSGVF